MPAPAFVADFEYRPCACQDGPITVATGAGVILAGVSVVVFTGTVVLGNRRVPSSSSLNTVRRVIIGRASDGGRGYFRRGAALYLESWFKAREKWRKSAPDSSSPLSGAGNPNAGLEPNRMGVPARHECGCG